MRPTGAPRDTPHPDASDAQIERARAALTKGDWRDAADAARSALAIRESADAHELLGLACWWLSDIESLFSSRERAYRLFVDAGESRRAARIATWLDWDYRAFRGEPAVANGWLRRARRLLEGQDDCVEYGWLLMREADALLVRNAPQAVVGAAHAAALGRKHGDPDLEYVAMSLEGLARVSAGHVAQGMEQLDEATAAVVAGDFMDRSAAGVTCCHLITACELVRDFDRAGQWCVRVKEFCRTWDHPPLFAVCRTQYAGVLVASGRWESAEQEISASITELGEMRPGWIALGHIQRAELRRRQGALAEARSIFAQFPWAPPAWLGLAAIALEEGVPSEAERLSRRFLRQVPAGNHTSRATALELIVLAAAASGRAHRVADELQELQQLAESVESDAIRAGALIAEAAVVATDRDHHRAFVALEESVALYDRAGMPYESTRARLLLAEALQSNGEIGAAVAELDVTIQLADALGALGIASHATTLRTRLQPNAVAAAGDGHTAAATGLTKRECDVLDHLVQGLTNRQISHRLGVSEHTVHRHLANIFTKLGLSSRAAAVAFAVRHGIGPTSSSVTRGR